MDRTARASRRRGRRLLLSPTPAARRRERVSPLRVLPPPRSARRRAPPRPHSNLQGQIGGEEDGGYCYPQHRLHGAAKECLLSESCPHPDQQGEEHRRDHTQTFRVRSEAKRTEVTAIPNTGCTAPRKSVSSPSPAPTPISKAKSTAATTLKPSGSKSASEISPTLR